MPNVQNITQNFARPSYRPEAPAGMDPDMRRMAIVAAGLGCLVAVGIGIASLSGHKHHGVPVIEAMAGSRARKTPRSGRHEGGRRRRGDDRRGGLGTCRRKARHTRAPRQAARNRFRAPGAAGRSPSAGKPNRRRRHLRSSHPLRCSGHPRRRGCRWHRSPSRVAPRCSWPPSRRSRRPSRTGARWLRKFPASSTVTGRRWSGPRSLGGRSIGCAPAASPTSPQQPISAARCAPRAAIAPSQRFDGGLKPAIVGIGGPALRPDEAACLHEAAPLGVILFARNVQDPAQLRSLIGELRACLPERALLMVDQEGGTRGAPAAATLARPPPRTRAALGAGCLADRRADRVGVCGPPGSTWSPPPCWTWPHPTATT